MRGVLRFAQNDDFIYRYHDDFIYRNHDDFIYVIMKML